MDDDGIVVGYQCKFGDVQVLVLGVGNQVVVKVNNYVVVFGYEFDVLISMVGWSVNIMGVGSVVILIIMQDGKVGL